MKDTFSKKLKRFHELIDQLIVSGWTKKKVSEELDIFPSVLSVIINKVTPKLISAPKDQFNDQFVSEILSDINNVSENKLKRNIDLYLVKLTELSHTHSNNQHISFFQALEDNTPYDKLRSLCGLYHCYYLSSMNYKIKKEPLIIGKNINDNKLWVQKGNENGPTSLKGILYTTNNQLLTIQIIEEQTVVPDQFIAHFALPPIYNHVEILRGMGISFSNSYLPICRKIILKKISSSVSMQDFQKETTTFYDDYEVSDSIVKYLSEDNSYLEYYHIPRPQFDERDLEIESNIRKTQKLSHA